MRLDETLESWDEIPNLEIHRRAGQLKIRYPDGSAELDDVLQCVRESIEDYQNWFVVPGPDPWTVELPFAKYVKEGTKLLNRNSGDEYTVTRAEPLCSSWGRNAPGWMLSLKGSTPPLEGERLEIPEDSRIAFQEASGEKYDVTAFGETEVTRGWTDRITFFLTRREPAGLSGPFSRDKQVKPLMRKAFSLRDDRRFEILFRDHYFDNIVQFDCWSRTVREANDLVLWFEEFMQKYQWVWKLNCLGERGEILYWQRGSEEPQQQQASQSGAVRRSVRYFFRTMKAYYGISRKLTQLSVTRT